MPVIKINNCLNCGVPHEWTFSSATLKELREIKKLTGLTIKGFAAAGDDGDPDAIAALVYILHRRDKINVRFDDVDVDFSDFEQEPTEEEAKAIEELEAEMKKQADEMQAPKAS